MRTQPISLRFGLHRHLCNTMQCWEMATKYKMVLYLSEEQKDAVETIIQQMGWDDVIPGQRKSLSDLLWKYGEIHIVEGYLCRDDERKLLNLDKNLKEFKEKCKKSLISSGKRCILSPSGKENLSPDDNTDKKNGITSKPNLKKSRSNLFVDSFHDDTHDSVCTDSLFGISPLATSTPSVNSSVHKSVKKLPPLLPKPVNLFPELAESPVETDIDVRNGCDTHSGIGSFLDHGYSRKPKQSRSTASGGNASNNSKSQKEKSVGVISLEKVSDDLCVHDTELTPAETAEIMAVLPLKSVQDIAEEFLNIPVMKKAIERLLLQSLSNETSLLRNRKNGKLSYLMKTDYEDLKNFEWDEVVVELCEEFPLLARALVSFILPSTMETSKRMGAIPKLIPKIGTVYAILAQARNQRLSKVQKIVNILLHDSICDQKVFDKFHTMGLCLCYAQSLRDLEKLGGNFKDEIIDAIKDHKRIRIVGDNINWYTGVHDVRQDSHGHMHHAFGSAVIVQNMIFDHLNPAKPQLPFYECPVDYFLPNKQDWDNIAGEFIHQIGEVVVKFMPAFHFLKKVNLNPESEELQGQKSVNKVIPLPILHLNEQKYEDVVQIMDFYENLLDEVYDAAGKELRPTHIGGDQLTRERFSGAKRLRIGGTTPKERYSHLTPITFELFHLLMNFVKLILQNLYHNGSVQELGTMKCEETRILRDNVDLNVNEHYDGDKDFICSFTDAYIVEAVADFFGMQDLNSRPTKNIPPATFPSQEAKLAWAKKVFREFVDKYVFNIPEHTDGETVLEDGYVFTVKLGNGKERNIFLKRKTPSEDYVKNYAHRVLELGLFFKSLLHLCKSPNRSMGLSLIKLAAMFFKANNNLSKYAYECMRFLVQQMCTLSEKEAAEQFYGLFVNTKGRLDSHIPADLQMEYIVKLVKKHLKHMFSNKTEKNITTRTGAITATSEISDNFDKTSGVIVRAKKHSDADSKNDELDMINDLRNIKPFSHQGGRKHDSFSQIKSSLRKVMNPLDYCSWIQEQMYKWATEIGQ